MKNKLLFILVLIPFLVSAQGSSGIQFETGTWSEILAKAKKENKYVFVDAFTTWCGPCKWMDANVFPQAEVGTFFNKNFINAKIDMEKGEGIDLAKKYEVQAYPTYLFVSSDGELVHRAVGSMQADAFIKIASNSLDPEKQYGTLLRRYDKGERSPEFLLNLAMVAKSTYDNKRAQQLADEYLKGQTNWLEERNLKLIAEFTASPESPYFDFMKKNDEAFKNLIGKDDYEYKMFWAVYNGVPRKLELKREVAKEDVPAILTKADGYFDETLPTQAGKLKHQIRLDLYRMSKDWNSYANEALSYNEKYPSTNANELNSLAWNIFENVDDKSLLKKALNMALESVKIEEAFYNTDTAANLYFKVGDKAKAKEMAERAIALGKKDNQDTSDTEKLLTQINQ